MPAAPGMRHGPHVRAEEEVEGEEGREMEPVQRRQSSSEQHIRYDAYRLLMVSEITSLNAVEEAMMIRLSRHATTVVTATESSGIELRGSTYCES